MLLDEGTNQSEAKFEATLQHGVIPAAFSTEDVKEDGKVNNAFLPCTSTC